MDLITLGFDDWFGQRAAALQASGCRMARVTAVDRGAFMVRNEAGETTAELAGKFRFGINGAMELPCVGDWVGIRDHATGGSALIHGVVPRKTLLRRKSPGRTVDFQVIAANLDIAFIVQACGFDFNPARLDRYFVTVNEAGIEPWIILTKTDLVASGQLDELLLRLRRASPAARILALSNTTGLGFEEFRALLMPGKTYCLLGSSGVGKTTLLNRLIGRDAFATRPVSATGEGVHTTSRRQLFVLDQGAMVIDTPGMRELGLLGTGEGVGDTFAEISEHSAACRFADCTHAAEPGCAVRQAVEQGLVGQDRYESFLKLKKEADHHALSYAGKREKDRSFGRFIKSAKKSLKK